MQLDFWNNPLVVSAFRVQYRRGGLFSITVVYLLIWATVGAVLEYYRAYVGSDWARIYFLVLIGFQFVLSGLIAMNATNASIRNEVTRHTLDFQRITALSPAEILVGKLLGEPALAYLLAMVTFPLGLWCWLMGARGVTFEVLVLAYVLLATGTLLCGALGLLHRLEPPTGRQTGAGAGLGVIAVFLLGAVNMLRFVGPGFATSGTWPAPFAGLLTPLPLIVGLGKDQDAWAFELSLFGYEIPYILLAPLAQLLVAYLCFHVMERRMVNPANPPYSKRLAYVTLTLVDVLLAAMLYTTGPTGHGFGQRAAAFCVSHLLLGIWLVTGVTPWRETLLSWVWRFRGRQPRLVDWWLGDRSENSLVLLTFAAIGLLVFVLLVVLPEASANGWGTGALDRDVLVPAAAVTTVLLLSLGMLYQWFVFIAGRFGKTAFVLLLMLVDLVPHIVGSSYNLPWVLALSPSAHAVRWLEPSIGQPLAPLSLLALYGTALVAAWWSLRRRLDRLESAVDHKLRQMGAVAGN
jgi:hypothetical protein